MPACRSPIRAEDAARRNKAHVPEAIRFRTKPQIALAQIRAGVRGARCRADVCDSDSIISPDAAKKASPDAAKKGFTRLPCSSIA
jgi:hypothetical protein